MKRSSNLATFDGRRATCTNTLQNKVTETRKPFDLAVRTTLDGHLNLELPRLSSSKQPFRAMKLMHQLLLLIRSHRHASELSPHTMPNHPPKSLHPKHASELSPHTMPDHPPKSLHPKPKSPKISKPALNPKPKTPQTP